MQNFSGEDLREDHYIVLKTYTLCRESSPDKYYVVWHTKLHIYAETSYEGEASYSKIPYDMVCSSRKQGGLGIKNLSPWNRAYVAKLVWAIENRKDSLWIHWVHGRYIKGREWWVYTPRGIQVGIGKKLHRVKELFKDYPKEDYKGPNRLGNQFECYRNGSVHYLTKENAFGKKTERDDLYNCQCSYLSHLANKELVHVQGEGAPPSTDCQGNQRSSNTKNLTTAST
ncbi:LOW QUALITY PROTEIN: hypothetical protein Cgig2_031548 [Carnegiea gigantea]|uniref:Uncharacterized protein n=1 Tax=Carnegiea gigantea TaxID=171969 RepID=A0A9Q1JHR3_9CARY|nr:LOW QUALITY PROTEIN: hypothetical protein Cgig2_031548 [Carnegiea gigantea]